MYLQLLLRYSRKWNSNRANDIQIYSQLNILRYAFFTSNGYFAKRDINGRTPKETRKTVFAKVIWEIQ